MALSYVGGISSVIAASTATTTTLTYGLTGGSNTTPSVGDLIIVSFATGSTVDRTLALSSSGFTNVADLYANDTYDTNLSVWYKIATSGDLASVVIGATLSASDAGAAAVHVWRGIDPNTPIDVTSTTGTGANGGTPDPASITPATTGAQIIVIGAYALSTSTTMTASYASNVITVASSDTNDVSLLMGNVAWTSGAYDPAAFGNASTSTSASWAAVTMAIRPVITGTFAATETGSDTFASTGTVLVQGSLSVSETGSDTFASTGTVLVQGSLSTSETGNDTFASTGTILVQGSLAATETGSDTFAATGYIQTEINISASITANATITAAGNYIRLGVASIDATATITALASKINHAFASIDTTSTVSALSYVTYGANAIIEAAATILATIDRTREVISNINASASVIASLTNFGYNWDTSSAGTETWNDVTPSSNTWTSVTTGNETWIRQG
jgi:hypothetical protein